MIDSISFEGKDYVSKIFFKLIQFGKERILQVLVSLISNFSYSVKVPESVLIHLFVVA